MPCILKALLLWILLLVVSGSVGLFLRQAFFWIFVPFPAEPENAAIAEALRDTRRDAKRSTAINTIWCLAVSFGYLWTVFHFFGTLFAGTAFVIMLVVVEHYAQAPRWLHHLANLIMWASVIPVWYALCHKT
ncbi:MAG: hypothetical protein ABIT38_11280 [Gemmatimonadaceae bacterium]